ncbi:MAG: hypothetical protein R2852_04390 [Bacteroidia bacterium]
MKKLVQDKSDLKTLTELLSNNSFTETKPYLTRRKLNAEDKRFKYIELVYESPEQVGKIFWHLDINLSRLIEYFGNPRFHFTPHGNSTSIGFFDVENQFTGFETRYPGEVNVKGSKYEVIHEKGLTELKDELNISFVSYYIGSGL